MYPSPMKTVVRLLTDNMDFAEKLILAFANNGAEVKVSSFKSLEQNLLREPTNILIFDLDSYCGKDCEGLKEILSELATRILFVCTQSFQRLDYYKEFEVFSSVENLLEREFFAY